MAIRIRRDIPQEATDTLTHVLRDLDGSGLGPSAVDAVTLTLYDEASGDIINSRDRQDVLNANGGMLATNGTLTIRLDPEDTVVLDDDLDREWHMALIEWAWTPTSSESPAPQYHRKAEVAHRIRNLEKVPA